MTSVEMCAYSRKATATVVYVLVLNDSSFSLEGDIWGLSQDKLCGEVSRPGSIPDVHGEGMNVAPGLKLATSGKG